MHHAAAAMHHFTDEHAPRHAVCPLSTAGVRTYIYCGGAKRNINLFCARLCSSCAPIVFAYERQNEESFLDALVKTFEYFGGVPQRVIFDNAKVAVKEGFGVYASKQDAYEYGGLELTAEAARFYTSGRARFTPPGGHILQ